MNLNVKGKNGTEILGKFVLASKKAKMTGPHVFMNVTLVVANPIKEAFPGRVPIQRGKVRLDSKLTNI